MDDTMIRLNGREYIYDGQKWFSAGDHMQPPLSVTSQLEGQLPSAAKLAVRMQARRAGRSELRHFFAYHSPEVMGVTAEECDGLEFHTSKKLADVIGDVLWFVAKARQKKRFFLRSYYVIESVRPSIQEGFEYSIGGSEKHAGVFEPMQELTDLAWFQAYFPTTKGSHGLGMHTIPQPVVEEFKKLASSAGHAFVY